MFLFSDMNFAGELLALTRHVKLESEEDFQDIFVEELNFTPPSI
jgi:hypothetical protein